MTILDLIKKSAITLNVAEILNDNTLDDISDNNQEEYFSKNFELKRMFEFAKIVINEIGSYVPQITETKMRTNNKKIDLISFDNLLKVISVKNNGADVEYSQLNGLLVFEEDGNYTIKYERCPVIVGITDWIDTRAGSITDTLLIDGLNAYYCLAVGLYAEYNVYHAKYTDKLSQLKSTKLFAMPCRSWND